MSDFKLFLIDTETGGLDPLNHSLLSGYVAILNSDLTIEQEYEFKHRDPVLRVTPDALAINKIDLRTYADQGTSSSEISQKIRNMCAKVYKDTGMKPHPMGQNVTFDLDFLSATFPELSPMLSRRFLDTSVLALDAQLQGKLPSTLSLSLGSLGKHFSLNTDKWHDAKADALLCLEIYKCLKKLT